MTLDEAIKHCEEKAKSNRNEVERGAWEKDSLTEQRCIKCAEEHEQLAEWLKDYKRLLEERPKGYWDKINYGDYESPDIAIRCSECLEEVEEESDFCPHCGCEMWRPNCVRCDRFGNCDGCEKREEE